jgi:hypothetical protein
MNNSDYKEIPDVVEMAYQIIDLYRRNIQLEDELQHKEELLETYRVMEELRNKHSGKLNGIIIGALLDPKSVVNRGHKAIAEDALKGE